LIRCGPAPSSPALREVSAPTVSASTRFLASALVLLQLGIVAACAPVSEQGSPAPSRGLDRREYVSAFETAGDDIDLWIDESRTVRGDSGEALQAIGFSFVSYRGFIGAEDVHRSSGTVFLPASPSRAGEVAITELPPGITASGFPFVAEYGHRPALELGIATAIMDVRGPIATELRQFVNPDAAPGQSFVSEEQLAYSQLRAFQETADPRDLLEWHHALAWMRAIRAVQSVLESELGWDWTQVVLTAEGRGALAASQAAAFSPAVIGLVTCGWPADWLDYHFVRWRRWEREARHAPLASVQPIPWRNSQALVSFLVSRWEQPDPGCPSCQGSGSVWRGQYEVVTLRDTRALDHVRILRIVGDSDPDLPIDLEARLAAPAEALASFPRPLRSPSVGPMKDRPVGYAFPRGPWNVPRHPPWDELTYLPESRSTLAHEVAAEAALGWIQHVAGHRDLPGVVAFEGTIQGDLVLDFAILEGNAPVTEMWLELVDIGDDADSDFRRRLHRRTPEPMGWRRVEVFFNGPGRDGASLWRARFPLSLSRNQAYYPVVRTRAGDLSMSHSLPIRVFWNLGDPARGAARF